MAVVALPVGPLQTNCYLVFDGERAGVVVDPGGDAPQILEAIEAYGLRIEAVLFTHVHFDHILAAAAVMEATGAPLYVPAADEAAMTDHSLSMTPRGIALPERYRLLADGDTVRVGTMTFAVLHTPGHTPGSSCFLCGDGAPGEHILLAGDTLFADSIGRTDFAGGDGQAMAASLKRLAALEGDFRVLPGHGPDTTLEHERQYNPYMREVL